MLLEILLASGALAGIPQCGGSSAECRKLIGETIFADHYLSARFGYPSSGEAYEESICNAENWALHQVCQGAGCPLSLEITEPPQYRQKICLNDHLITPFESNGHIDLNHPMNGKTLDIEVAGTSPGDIRAQACSDEDFESQVAGDGKVFDGKIVLVPRGGCYFFGKYNYTNNAGAAAAIIVDSSKDYNTDLLIGGSGAESFSDMLGFATARQYGWPLLELGWAGVALQGKITLQCGEPTVPHDHFWEQCPLPGISGCRQVANETNRLCAYCSSEFTPLGDRTDLAFCLHSSDLLPRKPEMVYWAQSEFPYESLELVYLADLPGEGCEESDFAGTSGMHIIFDEPATCIGTKAIRNAVAHGVAGVTVVGNPTAGMSNGIEVPVHSANDSQSSVKIKKTFTDHGSSFALASGVTAYRLDGKLAKGAPYEPYVEPAADDGDEGDRASEVVALTAGWEWSATVVVCLLFTLGLAAAVGVKIVGHVRRQTQFAPEKDSGSFAVPLSVASTGLSLTLLVLTATVAFVFTFQAGNDAADAAISNGDTAVSVLYSTAARNVNDLGSQLRTTIISGALSSVEHMLDSGEEANAATLSLFYRYNGSYEAFAEQWAPFWTQVQTRRSRAWSTQVETTRRFLYVASISSDTKFYRTDDRSDAERGDGLAHVTVTQNGAIYPYLINEGFDAGSHSMTFRLAAKQDEYDMKDRLGGSFGSGLDLSKDYAAGDMIWYVTRVSTPRWYDSTHPISVVSPIYNAEGDYHGAIESQTGIDDLSSAFDGLIEDNELLKNMILVLYDSGDQNTILSCNVVDVRSAYFEMSAVSLYATTRLLTFDNIPVVPLAGLGRYLRRTELLKDGSLSGTFEQREEYPDTPVQLAHLEAEAGGAVDLTDQFDVELRDCGKASACVAFDGHFGDYVYDFDAASALYLYQNLTSRSAIVRETFTGNATHWDNSFALFREPMTLPDGRTCMSQVDAAFDVRTCLLNPPIFYKTWAVSLFFNPDEPVAETNGFRTATLVEDLVEGGNVKLHANGQLSVGILSLGCRTRALGLVPAHSWTHVIAVATSTSCVVYVNGTLHDSTRLSSRFNRVGTQSAVVLARDFAGKMAQVRFFNTSVDDVEAASLSKVVPRTQKPVRHVDERQWFFNVATIQRLGLRLSVSALIPREDVMAQVDSNNARALSDLAIHSSNTHSTLRKSTTEAAIVVVVIALGSVLVFLVFNDFITAPFATIAHAIGEAALLRVDAIPNEKTIIRELNEIQTAMALMLGNLKEYKSYMPQNLVVDTSGSDDDETGTHISRDKPDRTSAGRSARSRATGSELSFGTSGITHDSGTRAAVALKMAELGTMALARKKMSMVVVNLCGWLRRGDEGYDSHLLAGHAHALTETMTAFATTKGVAELFSGDRFAATWNTARLLGTHRMAATLAAVGIRNRLADLGYKTSSAVASGEARVGNMGNENMKRFSFVSPVVTWVYALERYANYHGIPIVADHHVYDDVKTDIVVRVLDACSFPKRSTRPILIAEIVAQRQTKIDEWMYQIEENDSTDPYRTWNTWARSVVHGESELALEEREALFKDISTKYKDNPSEARYAHFYNRLSVYPFEVSTIPFH